MEGDAPADSGNSSTLEPLNFDNLALRTVPVDERVNDRTQRQVRGACYSRVEPTPVDNPQLVAYSIPAMSLIDLSPDQALRPEFAQYFSGNQLLPGSDPASHCYCGYQFGSWAGQLGDGAAITLGEVVNARGERWEMALKGAGLTPYSRHADGRKVLRSSIREFLASEAMYHLGIPTTRALCCVTSDSRVERDVFYDGNPTMERCSVVCRLAPSFWRFGSFEITKAADPVTGRTGPSHGMATDMHPGMVDYIIRTYYPNIWQAYGGDSLPPVTPGSAATAGGSAPSSSAAAPAPSSAAASSEARVEMYCDWLRELFRRTAGLVAGWQSVGFTHGVLNTDNMSILGLTLDYGPYGFMDRYDPDHVPNHSDDSGRYRYKAQPEMCRWNCERLCETLSPAVLPAAASMALLEEYDQEYDRCYWRIFRNKLGLLEKEKDGDVDLVNDLLQTMADTGADFTSTFRLLAKFPMPPPATTAAADGATAGANGGASSSGAAGAPAAHAAANGAAASGDGDGSAQDAAATEAALRWGDGGVLEELLRGLAAPAEIADSAGPSMPLANLQMLMMLGSRDPTILQQLGASQQLIQEELERARRAAALRRVTPEEKARSDRRAWVGWLDRYGHRLQSEAGAGADPAKRVRVMNATNPRYVLRQWVAQYAIEQAEKGRYEAVQAVLAVLQQPYSDQPSAQLAARAAPLPKAGGAAGGEAVVAEEEEGGPAACLVAMPPLEGPVPQWGKKLCVSCSS